VEVVRGLSGAAPKVGERVKVFIGGYVRTQDQTPRVREEPLIYFIPTIESDTKKKTTTYYLSCRLPIDQEEKVRAALKRRDDYPVREGTENEELIKYREVLFRGETAEALSLLGSRSDAAVTLAVRTLIHRRETARAVVVEAIEAEMFRFDEQKPINCRRLKNLVGILGRSAAVDGDPSAVDTLVAKVFARITSNAAAPPTFDPDKGASYFKKEEDREDVNHVLTWLLQQMSEGEVRERYGETLIKLRDGSKGRWKDEVQLALDVCRVEDHIELSAALKRMTDVKPVRTGAEMRIGHFTVLTFSHDGKLLATAGDGVVSVWNVSDWSLVTRFPQQGSMDGLAFSANDKLLYVIGGAGGWKAHVRYEWRTGKVDKDYEGHKSAPCELNLSADNKVMATASYYEGVFHVWDALSGKIVKSFDMHKLAHGIALSPDGKIFLHAKDKQTWAIETLAGEAPETKTLNLRAATFLPDGKTLVCVEPVPKEKKKEGADPEEFAFDFGVEKLQLKLRDVTQDFKEIATFTDDLLGPWIAVSDDGKRLAVKSGPAKGAPQSGAGPTDRFLVFSLPDLKLVSKCRVSSHGDGEIQSFALSPDGKMLAVTDQFHPTPYLFSTATGAPIRPVAGHTGRLQHVCFPDGGKTIRSFCSDNFTCLWDASTMKLLKRTQLRADDNFVSFREPDGKYAIAVGNDADKETARVVECETAKVVFELPLPKRDWLQRLPRIVWIDDNEALCITGDNIIRFDYRKGKVVKEWTGTSDRGAAYLSEDGKILYFLDGNAKYTQLEGHTLDLATGKFDDIGRVQMKHFTGNRHGLVPDGKHFYISDPDLYLLDRKTLKVEVEKHFRKTDMLGLTFNADGSRYAVITGGAIHVDRNLNRLDSGAQSLIRVHETKTGKTLWAFSPSTRWVGVQFSPDGRKLAVENDDDTIELWTLPESKDR
jgi:WD40 repeat protein